MTDRQKHRIDALRRKGYSHADVADEMDVPVNTVKSYCRRNQARHAGDLCRNCDRPLAQNSRTRQKHFCSNRCRQEWWNRNRDQIQHRDSRVLECTYCGCDFQAHGKRQRKYCSHACYAADRGG